MIKFYVICIALMTIVHFQNWGAWSAGQMSNSVCNTAECRLLADTYLWNMNRNVSPCTDFYDYVCHDWGKRNPRPESADSWTVQDVLALKELKRMKKLLEDMKPPTVSVENAKALYKACNKLPFMEKFEPDTIKSIMLKVGNVPIFNPKNKEINASWSSIDDQYIHKTAESALFDFTLAMVTDKQRCPITMKLQQLESPYGSIIRFTGWGLLSVAKSRYRNFLIEIAESVAPEKLRPFRNITESDVNRVITFREQLREIIHALPEKPDYELLSIKDLQEWYDKQANSAEPAQIDWLKKIRAIHENCLSSNNSSINEHTLVHVQKSYFSKLVGLLRQTPEQAIVNHIHLYFAERHLLLPQAAKEELDQSLANDIGITGVLRFSHPRWQWCIEYHDMTVTLRKMYIAAAFPERYKVEIENMAEETKHLLQEQIAESTWLDQEAKAKSIDKVKHISNAIGYPTWMNSTHTDEYLKQKEIDPLNPDAYYSYTNNRVYVTAAYLQPPIFVPNAPYPVKYGSTLFTFAHEMYHTFDQQILEYGSDGNKFWSNQMRKKFSDQLQCLVTQYNRNKVEEAKKLNIQHFLKYPTTVNEDTADVMGAKLAYRGYKQTQKKLNGTCTTLPGFEKMGCDQLFFIAFANTFCANPSHGEMRRAVQTSSHSLPRLRVNGVASNMKEFGAAFGCNAKDPMVLTKRCDIWKD